MADENTKSGIVGRPLTYGEKAVGLTFNHREGEIFDHVDSAKKTCAQAIDMMDTIRARSTEPDQKQEAVGRSYPLGFSKERIALATIAIRDLQKAQMMMVKAITWKE